VFCTSLDRISRYLKISRRPAPIIAKKARQIDTSGIAFSATC